MPHITIPSLTPDNRPWRIDWFGELLFPGGINPRSQANIRVAISPVVCDLTDQGALLSADATDSNGQRQRSIPVGMLPYINIGDIWHHGKCVHSPEYQQEFFSDVEISRATTLFIKSGLAIDNQFVLPLSQHPGHRWQTQSYCVSVRLPDQRRIVIPCMEIIRFYFGSSSSLLHKLFTTQISYEHLWKDTHFDSLSGRLHLKLSDEISGASASDIARIALDKEAWHAARMIFNMCQLALLSGNPVFTYTGFPFVGKTDLLVSGKWLSYGSAENATFVVYRLQSCSHPFPFQSLRYEVSDSEKIKARRAKLKNQAMADDAQKSRDNGSSGGKLTLSENNPGNSRVGKEFRMRTQARFPDLTKKQVWRERYDTVDAPEFMLMTMPTDEEISVGERIGSSKVRAVDIVSEVCAEISENDASVPKFVRNGIKIATKGITSSSQSPTTTLITLPGYTHPVISLPYLVDEAGEINPVSFLLDICGDQRLRRGCFVEIKVGDVSRYRVFIVEAQGATSKMQMIEVQELDLRLGMGKLIAVS